MSTDLFFAFDVDKSSNSINIVREFAAELPLVWDAFTKQEILDQWGAPEPWTVKTKSMDFRVGGRRLYAMYGPEGQEHWSTQDYTSISPMTNMQYLSGFADEHGNTHPAFSGSENNLDFSEANGITTVRITIKYRTAAILEMMVEKGFREGFTMSMVKLEKLLASIPKQ